MAKRTIPKSGWVVVGHIDHRAQVMPCAKCNRHVRYGVVLRHPDVQGTVEAGARCAVWLSGGTPERSAPHDAPAVPAATVSAEATIEAWEAADKYGAEMRHAELALCDYIVVGLTKRVTDRWIKVLADRRAGVSVAEIRRRAELAPGDKREISLRRMTQLLDFLVADDDANRARA